MNNIIKRSYIGAIAAISMGAVPATLIAQEDKDFNGKAYYSFERIEQTAPWLKSGNGAGLIFSTTPMNFSEAALYYNNVNGDYRNYNQAKSSNNFGLDTKSYSHIGNVYFYGMFNYDRTTKNEQSWLGTVDENSNLAPMTENVPGKVVTEQYILQAGVGYKFSNNFAVGFDVNYRDASAAKKKDGRNKNILSNFTVSPGVVYSSKYINAGANFIYRYDSEKANYTYLGDTKDKELYYFEGLFFYSAVNAGATGLVDSRKYETNYYGVGGQVELKAGVFSFYNQFRYITAKQNNFETYNFAKNTNSDEIREYDYQGVFSVKCKKIDNYLKIGFNSNENALNAVINSYREVEGEQSQFDWYKEGEVLRYMDSRKTYSAEYTGVIKRSETFANVSWCLGYSRTDVEKEHKNYPADYTQDYKLDRYYASIEKSFICGDNSFINIGVNGGYVKGSGNSLTETNPLESSSIRIHKELLATDYLYNVTDHTYFGGNIKYSYIVNAEKGYTAWIKAGYLYRKMGSNAELSKALSSENISFNKDSRQYFNVTIGFNF